MRKTFCDRCGKEITEDVEWVFNHELCPECAKAVDIFIAHRQVSPFDKTEELIRIFGTLCDYMVDNGGCNVFCPYAETKDTEDECEAWRTIQKIRQEE